MKKYDVIIIGSGIAGISASIYLKRSNKSVLIIESNVVGGQLNRSSIIENYPGYTSIDGPSLAYNLYNCYAISTYRELKKCQKSISYLLILKLEFDILIFKIAYCDFFIH